MTKREEIGVVIKSVCSRCKGNRWVSIIETFESSQSMHNETCPECGGLGFTVEPLIEDGKANNIADK